MNRLGIIGYGRVGKALLFALKKDKKNFIEVCEKSKNRLPESIKFDIDDIKDFDCIFVCVNDDAIEEITEKLKSFKGHAVFHSASFEMKTAEKILKKASSISILHPIQSFSAGESKENQFRSIYATLEERGKNMILHEFIKRNKINVIKIKKNTDRNMYHLSAMLAGNYTLSLLLIASGLLKKSLKNNRADYRVFLPMVNSIVKRINKENPKNVLSGPSARGDRGKIERMKKGLKDNDLSALLDILDRKTRKELER